MWPLPGTSRKERCDSTTCPALPPADRPASPQAVALHLPGGVGEGGALQSEADVGKEEERGLLICKA